MAKVILAYVPRQSERAVTAKRNGKNGPSSRAPGKRAGLTLASILEAASTYDPAELTMQKLAAKLGVDPKALNYHVGSFKNLLVMLANGTFEELFSVSKLSTLSWQEACRTYARAITAAAIKTGPLLTHIDFDSPQVTSSLAATDILMGQLVSAGFTDEQAARSVALLSNICFSYAVDAATAKKDKNATRAAELDRALEFLSGDDFPNLRRIAGAYFDTDGDEQLEFSIDVFIAGLEEQLKSSKTTGSEETRE